MTVRFDCLDSGSTVDIRTQVLGGRAHSAGELNEKLRRARRKGGRRGRFLARLKDHGYLDDRRFAEISRRRALPTKDRGACA